MTCRYSPAAAAVLTLLALGTIALGCGSDDNTAKSDSAYTRSNPLKVGFIYIGAPNDGGYNQANEEGRQYVEQVLGPRVETTYKANVPISPQVAQVTRELVSSGSKLIILASAGYQNYVLPLAKQNPDVRFAEFETPETSSNFISYDIETSASTYLAGMALAGASKNDKIGLVSSFPYPGNIQQINGYALGARRVNPKAEVHVVFINSFFDPPKERQAASALVSAGVGALATTQNDAAPGQVANRAGIPWVGNTLKNGAAYGPETWLTNTQFGFGPLFAELARLTLQDKPLPRLFWGRWKDEMALLDPWGPAYSELVPEDVQAQIEAVEKELDTGTFEPFTGPIRDQNGEVRVPEGESLSPEEISGINWGVEGVVGRLE